MHWFYGQHDGTNMLYPDFKDAEGKVGRTTVKIDRAFSANLFAGFAALVTAVVTLF